MDFHRLLSDTADRSIATPALIERNVHNSKTAPLTDVIHEQLEYLIGHFGRKCPPDCIDCDRLQQVRHWLLLPFRSGSRSKRCFAATVLRAALTQEIYNPSFPALFSRNRLPSRIYLRTI